MAAKKSLFSAYQTAHGKAIEAPARISFKCPESQMPALEEALATEFAGRIEPSPTAEQNTYFVGIATNGAKGHIKLYRSGTVSGDGIFAALKWRPTVG